MHKVDIAGLQVNAVTKQQLLDHVAQRTRSKQKTFVTTVYSEFLYQSMRDNEIRTLLNKADIAVADGIGVLWAQTFLARPFTVGNFYLKIIQAWWQVVITGATILLHPKAMYKVFPEKIVGASLIWDLAALADSAASVASWN